MARSRRRSTAHLHTPQLLHLVRDRMGESLCQWMVKPLALWRARAGCRSAHTLPPEPTPLAVPNGEQHCLEGMCVGVGKSHQLVHERREREQLKHTPLPHGDSVEEAQVVDLAREQQQGWQHPQVGELGEAKAHAPCQRMHATASRWAPHGLPARWEQRAQRSQRAAHHWSREDVAAVLLDVQLACEVGKARPKPGLVGEAPQAALMQHRAPREATAQCADAPAGLALGPAIPQLHRPPECSADCRNPDDQLGLRLKHGPQLQM